MRGSARISKAARDAIQSKARELDYIPNANAKALVLQRSQTVGLLPEITRARPACNDVAYLARLAVERLLSLIDNQSALPPPKFDFLRGDLVVRESTAAKSKSI